MKSFGLTVKAKLSATLMLLAALLVGVGAMGFVGTRSTSSDLEMMFNGRLLPASWMDDVNGLQRRSIESIEMATIKQDAETVATAVDTVKDNSARIRATWQQLNAVEVTEEERNFITRLGEFSNTLLSANEAATLAVQAGDFAKAETTMLEESRPTYEKLVDTADDLQAAQITAAQGMWSEAQARFRRNNTLMIGAILLGIVVASVVGTLLIRSISSALNVAVDVANRIATGHVGNHIEVRSRDELGQLLASLAAMDAKLVEIVGGVRSTADSVGSAAGQLSQGNDDLSSRTQEQA